MIGRLIPLNASCGAHWVNLPGVQWKEPTDERPRMTGRKGGSSSMKDCAFLRCAMVLMLTAGSLCSPLLSSSVQAQESLTVVPKAVDSDGDGTISLGEAKAAATDVFDKIDLNHDGVVNNTELGGRVTLLDQITPCLGHQYYFWKKEKTLDKDQYVGIVEGRFKALSAESGGVCDANALKTDPGKSLLELLTVTPKTPTN
jgi:hypothetical protein